MGKAGAVTVLCVTKSTSMSTSTVGKLRLTTNLTVLHCLCFYVVTVYVSYVMKHNLQIILNFRGISLNLKSKLFDFLSDLAVAKV